MAAIIDRNKELLAAQATVIVAQERFDRHSALPAFCTAAAAREDIEVPLSAAASALISANDKFKAELTAAKHEQVLWENQVRDTSTSLTASAIQASKQFAPTPLRNSSHPMTLPGKPGVICKSLDSASKREGSISDRLQRIGHFMEGVSEAEGTASMLDRFNDINALVEEGVEECKKNDYHLRIASELGFATMHAFVTPGYIQDEKDVVKLRQAQATAKVMAPQRSQSKYPSVQISPFKQQWGGQTRGGIWAGGSRGGGGGGGGHQPSAYVKHSGSPVTYGGNCFACNKPGHRAANCPGKI